MCAALAEYLPPRGKGAYVTTMPSRPAPASGPRPLARDDSRGTDTLRYAASALVLAVLVIVVSTLALAPVHGVHDAAACQREYAEARTRTDSISVDTRSFRDPAMGHLMRRCGEVRTP